MRLVRLHIISAVFVLSVFFACPAIKSKKPVVSEKIKIGVSMPNTVLQRWQQDGANIKSQLEIEDYAVSLYYAGENNVDLQINQIKEMISSGVQVLIIAAIDGNSLTDALKDAKQKKISVIAYDRLIMYSDALSYYITFDNNRVGQFQGQFIVDKLDLNNNKGPFYLEAITGTLNDNNTKFFFGGALSVIKPYLDNGTIIVPSGQLTISDCGVDNWLRELAESRMSRLIQNNNYRPGGSRLDAVLCSNDALAFGAASALQASGWTQGSGFPLITGQDCDKINIKNMIAGYQAMSVFKDTRMLAAKVVNMVDAIIKGITPEINDTVTYFNGISVIPAYLCEPAVVTIENYREMLIDSDYYTEDELR